MKYIYLMTYEVHKDSSKNYDDILKPLFSMLHMPQETKIETLQEKDPICYVGGSVLLVYADAKFFDFIDKLSPDGFICRFADRNQLIAANPKVTSWINAKFQESLNPETK